MTCSKSPSPRSRAIEHSRELVKYSRSAIKKHTPHKRINHMIWEHFFAKSIVRSVTSPFNTFFASVMSQSDPSWSDLNHLDLVGSQFHTTPKIGDGKKEKRELEDVNMDEDMEMQDVEMEDSSEEPWIGDMLLKSLQNYIREQKPELKPASDVLSVPARPVRPPLLRNMFEELSLRDRKILDGARSATTEYSKLI